MGHVEEREKNRKTRVWCFAARFTASGHEVDIQIATPSL
jgi:hypothetical protein